MSKRNEINHIRVAYAELPPFVEIISDDIPGGFMPAILKSIALWMGLNVSWIREPEDKYGTWENGTWDGMCGMIFRNEVDVIVNPLLPSEEFAKVVYYSNPVVFESFTYLSGKEKKEGGLFLYFSVLDTKVWFGIGISLIAIALVSTALIQKPLDDVDFDSWILTFGQSLWGYITFLLRQIPNEKKLLPTENSYRSTLILVLITLWVVGISFVIMNVFQSLLVSKMTIVKSYPVVDTMEELLNKRKVKGVAPREIELHEILKGSNIPLYERAWEKLEPDLMSFEEVLSEKTFNEIIKGTSVMVNGMILTQSALMNYFKMNGRCDFHLSKNYFFPFPLLMGLRKDLPKTFLRKFNVGLTRLIDADISGKWLKPIYTESKLCTSYSESDLKPLQMKNIFGVLVIWGVGMGISFACFIAEILYFESKPSEGYERRLGNRNQRNTFGNPNRNLAHKNIKFNSRSHLREKTLRTNY